MKIILLSLYITNVVAVDLAITANNAIAHYEDQMPESAIRAIEWRDTFSHKVHKHQNVLKLIETKNYVELFKIYDSPDATDEEKTRHMRLLVMLGQNTHNQELLHKIKEKIKNKIGGAIQYDFISFLQELITQDNINTPLLNPNTLMHAAYYGSTACAQLLINAGAAINAQTTDGCTALFYTAKQGQAETMKLLLKAKADTNLRHKDYNDTPLMAAACNGHIRCVQLLIDADATINAQTIKGATALHYAAQEGHAETVKLLLNAKADTDLKDNGHDTPLMMAACNGHTHCVQLLIDADTNVNAQNTLGTTALYYAAQEGQAETMKLLLKAKADTNLRHRTQYDTPLTMAAHKGHIHCVQLLISADANINAQTTTGKTALHYAAQQGHVDIVHLLLKAGANINAQTIKGTTALYYAAQEGHAETMKLLLTAKADTDLRHKDYNDTPLTMAAHKGHIHCVQLLIGADANINAQTTTGNTALHYAARQGHAEIVQLLKAGADASQVMDTCIKNNEFDALKFIVAVQQKIIASAQQAS